MDWLKEGRMKIKLTNIVIAKYVQECKNDILLYWGGMINGGSQEERRKEGRKKGKE